MGIERARHAPHLLPPRAQGGAARGAALRDRSAAHLLGRVGRRLPPPRGRIRHRARQRRRARHPRSRPRGSRLHRARHHRLRRLPREPPALPARAGRPRHRRAPGPRRADGPRLRPRRPGHDLLDPGHHRAPQRGRQRARPHQPGPPHGARGPLGLGAQPAARAEQRAGRRRHGRPAQQAHRVSRRRGRSRPREVRARLGRLHPPEERVEPHPDVRGHGPRRPHRAPRLRREPRPVRGRRRAHPGAAPGPRGPGGAGSLPHPHGRARPRGAPRIRQLLRGRGHGDQQRAEGPAGARLAAPAGQRPRRHRHPGRPLAPHGQRPRRSRPHRAVGRAARAQPHARGHELPEAGGARRHPVAVPRRGAPRLALPPRAALGGARARPARAVLGGRARGPRRGRRCAVPPPPHHRPPARLVQHRRAVRGVLVASPSRRDARPLPRRRRRARRARGRARPGELAPRVGRGAGALRPGAAPGPGVHDLPLPRRGRHQPPHHRRHRSQVGDGGVQGGRGAHRPATIGETSQPHAAQPAATAAE